MANYPKEKVLKPGLYTPKEKDKQVKAELVKLRKLLDELPVNRKKAADGLVQEIAFMKVTLDEARYIIDQEGVLEHFEQGAQNFMREHPAVKVYGRLIPRYAMLCKTLTELMPASTGAGIADPLAEFLSEGGKR